MTFRNGLLATVAVVALGAGSASAQGFGGGGFYLKGFGGATFADDESFGVSGPIADAEDLRFGIDYDTGFLLGAALGYGVTPNIDVEVEYAYREVDGTFEARTGDGRDREDGTVNVNAVMLNAIYRFDPMGAQGLLRPYLGAGLGGARVDFDGEETDTEFAWQVMGGVDYALTQQWSLYGEARYFSVDDGRFVSDSDLRITGGYDSIDLLFGAAYRF